MISEVVINSLFAVLSAMLGAAVVFLIKLNHNRLCALISLSGGALLGAGLVGILPETLEHLTIFSVIPSAATGYLLFWAISKYYFHICPACSASHFDLQATKRFSEVVRMLFIALSIHSFFDGLAITAEHGHTHGGGEHSILIAIIIHKFPEGLALASLMFGANYSRNKIMLYVLLVELTTLLGGLTGYFMLKADFFGDWLSVIEAHIAGGFIYLALHAVTGEIRKNHKALVMLYFGIGFLLIALTKFLH